MLMDIVWCFVIMYGYSLYYMHDFNLILNKHSHNIANLQNQINCHINIISYKSFRTLKFYYHQAIGQELITCAIYIDCKILFYDVSQFLLIAINPRSQHMAIEIYRIIIHISKKSIYENYFVLSMAIWEHILGCSFWSFNVFAFDYYFVFFSK